MKTLSPRVLNIFDYFCLNKKYLVYNLVTRNLKVKYRRSILGVFWSLLSPIALAMVNYFVIRLVMKVQLPNYMAFVMSGIFFWAFFSQNLNEGLECVVNNWELLSKVPVPFQIFPYVGCITNLVSLAFALPIVLAVSFFTGVELGSSLIALPYLTLILFLMSYSITLLASVAFVYLRDLKHIISILLQLWFYATPVIYDESMVPEKYRWVLAMNPLQGVFSGFHRVLVQGVWPEPAIFIKITIITLLLMLFSAWVRASLAGELAEQI